MRASWDQLRELGGRNLPSRKPQLWEDCPLAFRRRIAFELGHRLDAGWLDRPHMVALSGVGFPHRSPPLKMEVVPREMMNRAMFLYGTFEISETRLVQALLRPGMTFLDVGANIGYYTLIAARLVGATGVVHSFEPSDAMRPKLEANIRRNGFVNVTVHPEAVAQATGEVEFFASQSSANQGISSILPGEGRAAAHKVPSLSLDDFQARLGGRRVDLVKMDIEGAELLAIEGGRLTFSHKDAPPLIFEARDPGPIAETLESLGYQIRRLHYTLEEGLQLPGVDAPLDSLFDDYEAPNYLAAKDPAIFGAALARANTRRSPILRLLGRI